MTHDARVGRVIGFAACLCVLAAFVTVAATGAAAQRDRGPGSTRGHDQEGRPTLTIDVGSTTDLQYDGLMPGEARTRSIDYAISSGGPSVDLWMVFDTRSAGVHDLTGAHGSPGNSPHTSCGLGPYAYVAVSDSNGGLAFESGDPPSDDPGTSPASGLAHTRVSCRALTTIRLGADLRTGTRGTVAITLGLDPTFTRQDAELPAVPFTLVATRHDSSPHGPASQEQPPRVPSQGQAVTSRW
jgi:hypothetical protein